MKKTLVIMLALFLAIPAISYAGSATSRWDLTIGGNIKFDMGWSDQSGGESGNAMWTGGIPDRNPASGVNTFYNKYGAQLWGAGETGLNFFVKGPDAWGAKTHALIVGDFTGFWGVGTDGTLSVPGAYNTFDLVIAEMGFDWENTSVTAGVSGSFWGQPMTWTESVGWNTINLGGKGGAPVFPQVTAVERFTKNWSAGFGIMSPYNTINQLQSPAGFVGAGNTYQFFETPMPAFEGKIVYSSDSCGKIGPWQLLVEADGFWGQVRYIFANLDNKDENEWNVDLKMVLPIIPEHNGNKAGALLFDWEVFMSQGAGQIGSWDANAGGGWLTAYFPTRTDPEDLASAPLWGAYLHAKYYITDAVGFNAWYAYTSSDPSRAMIKEFAFNQGAAAGFPTGGASALEGAVTSMQAYAANIVYDVNPAVRLTFEWDYTVAQYKPAITGFKGNGSNNDWRISAYYFF